MTAFWVSCGATLLLCLLVQAFFSGAEIAVVAADKARLREAAEKGSHGARLLTEMLERPERIFGATAAASTLSVVGAMTAAEAMGAAAWGVWGELAALLALPPFVLILGHVVPRSVFELRADRSFVDPGATALSTGALFDPTRPFDPAGPEALKVRPAYLTMIASRGFYFAGHGRPGEARAAFLEALALDPTFAPARRALASLGAP